jgi:hypothetical protein
MAIQRDFEQQGSVAVEGLVAAHQPVATALFDALADLADLVDDAFSMEGLNGTGDRAIIYFMTGISIALNNIADAQVVEEQLRELMEEMDAYGSAPGGIDADWWTELHAELAAARAACL